jgi:hypothetical protein
MTAVITASPSGAEPRAFVLLKSRRRLDLLNPDPHAWTDDDIAAGLSRTMRWGGASRWEHPLSVAQHSLTVLTIREADGGALTPGEALRELLHDATEFMSAGTASRRSKRSSANRSAPLMRCCRARSTHAIDSRNGRPRLTRSTSAPTSSRPRPKLSMSWAGAGSTCARPCASRKSRSSKILFRCAVSRLGSPGPRALPRGCSSNGSMHSNAPINPHCESSSPTSVPFPLLMEPNSCRILVMTPHSTLTQTETPQLTTNWRRSPANRLGRRLSIRNAISPIVPLLSTRSPRA